MAHSATRWSQTLLAATLAMLVGACGDDEPPATNPGTDTAVTDDGGGRTDAGIDAEDAGPGTDGGDDTVGDTAEDGGADAVDGGGDTGEDAGADAAADTAEDGGPCSDDCTAEGASRCEGTNREVCLTSDDGCLVWTVGEDCADTPGHICDDELAEALCVDAVITTCTDLVLNGEETDIDCGGPDCDPCADELACLTEDDCDSGVCNDDLCAAPTCSDEVLNGVETDVDCGGDCDACDVGDECAVGDDCTTLVCDDRLCVDASCVDGILNGDETDLDCGGSCSPCATEGACLEAVDCASGVCDDGFCIDATCLDGVTNGLETDTDCGGGECDPCPTGEDCGGDRDCFSGVCSRDVCQAANCSDLVRNGDETGIDCGGPLCDLCGVGLGCLSADDCTTGACVDGLCRRASCDDEVRNGDETGVDCGGDCDACDDGVGCGGGSDCVSGVCSGGICQAASCIDTIRNGSETDTDCGGFCPDCAVGGRCLLGSDCSTGVCAGGFCQPGSCGDGILNGTETDLDCGGSCGACADGRLCDSGVDCTSGYCGGGRCSSPSCDDRVINGTESDIDCGGAECDACAAGLACVVRGDCESDICTDGVCIAGGCTDAIRNGTETDIDCGGPLCDACPNGRGCGVNEDCTSSICTDGFCSAPRCDDLAHNGAETDVDCGGPTCGGCSSGATCDENSDCLSLRCFGGTCAEASCSDGLRNGTETDVDCGGSLCSPCIAGGSCLRPSDCATSVCELAVCQEAVCGDGVQNGTETDVDCGGACDPCAVGDGCIGDPDCLSGMCVDGGCEAAVCDDGVQNGAETDVDCGGACDGCPVGEMCTVNGDCVSGFCDDEICAAASCTDGVRNADETDIDCGGATCDECAAGLRCAIGADCTSMVCSELICAAEACDDDVLNGDETDVDCGGPTCGSCSLGEGCLAHTDCESDVCVGFSCEEPSCDDGIRNGTETDVDCGGSICGPCTLGRSCVISGDCFSDNCDIGSTNTCVASDTPTCADGVENGSETDVDCGGSICDPCELGEGCETSSDCVSDICDFLDTNTCVDATPSFDVDEDFETGDFSTFDYTFSGPAMVIEDDGSACHGGDFCMRNQVGQLGETTASIQTSLSIRENTTISFWARLNTEPDEHYLRFYINDELVFERSGQMPWTEFTFPVLATAAGAPNTSFRWEYTRSSFVSTEHPAWNEIWVDDIDMPAWNTEPSVPEQTAPWNNTAMTDATPTFEWRSFDPDFDPVIYVIEYDEDPAFGSPVVVPEQTETRFTPASELVDGEVYYWRVKAKDTSNFRWTDWSPIWSVQIDSTVPQGLIWRQTVNTQFNQNTRSGLTVSGDSVSPTSTNYSSAYQTITMPGSGTPVNFTFTGLPRAVAGATGTIDVTTCGEFASSGEYIEAVRIDGVNLGGFTPNRDCTDQTYSRSAPNVATYVNDGTAVVTIDPNVNVYYRYCSSGCNDFRVRIRYTSSGTGVMTTAPISFTAFPGATHWEKVQVNGTGVIRIRVLDADGVRLPESVLPGNAAGFSDRTLFLWDVDEAVYPELRLEATVEPGAVLRDWSLIGNTRYEWRFDNPADLEGWLPEDFGATPTLTVADGGIATYAVSASSTDPRIVYQFPQPVDATRFSRVEVHLRTGRDYRTETVSLWWDNNFGEFDVSRSLDVTEAFLFNMTTIAYDVSVDRPVGTAWEGDIEAIRIDPVERFLDVAGSPNAGSVEFDYIAIY